MAITAFSNLSITISDGGTVPSLDYLSTKTYVNIGTGNVLRVSWNTPTAADNAVDSYKITVLNYDSSSGNYKTLYSANIGDVNEFYLRASLLNALPQSFVQLRIYVEAISKYGSAYSGVSAEQSVYVSRGCGTYVKVSTGYPQPIMKRALAFTKLTGDTGISSVQDPVTGWTLMQEFHGPGSLDGIVFDSDDLTLVDANGRTLYIAGISWSKSDISYEVLTDVDGEIITDINDGAVYVL